MSGARDGPSNGVHDPNRINGYVTLHNFHYRGVAAILTVTRAQWRSPRFRRSVTSIASGDRKHRGTPPQLLARCSGSRRTLAGPDRPRPSSVSARGSAGRLRSQRPVGRWRFARPLTLGAPGEPKGAGHRCRRMLPEVAFGADLGSDTPDALPGWERGEPDTRPMADITTSPRPALRPASALRAVFVRRRIRATMASQPLSAEELRQLDRARSGDMRGLRSRDDRGDWVTL